MQKIKTSDTLVIKRSQVNLNPFNPKRHSDDAVTLQKKNIQKVGLLGGIVWNSATHNLVDGHRRMKALDVINKYDGTPETDYDVKVEVVALDEKSEKEQLTYMAVGNTKPDIDLISNYINDIDYSEVGLSDSELKEILSIAEKDVANVETFDDFLAEPVVEETMDVPQMAAQAIAESVAQPTKSYEERKQEMKDLKAAVKEKAIERIANENSFITLSFSNHQQKEEFCDLLGINTDDLFVKGEQVLALIH